MSTIKTVKTVATVIPVVAAAAAAVLGVGVPDRVVILGIALIATPETRSDPPSAEP